MPVINTERFVDILTNSTPAPEQRNWELPPPIREQIEVAAGIPRANLAGRIDRASALIVLGQIRDYVARRGYLNAKYLRPWEIDDRLYDNLDRTQPWWGLEFETGWTNQETRANAIRHTWDTWDNVVFDTEGEGMAAVEITFAPEEMSKYLDGTAQAYQFAQYLNDNPDTYNGGQQSVGMHINISHPQLVRDNLHEVVYGLNRTVAQLPVNRNGVDVRNKFFGRANLYGGFFNGQGNAVWTEGKLFRTTYDMDKFKMYVKVCEALTKAMEAIINAPPSPRPLDRPCAFVTNLYEMVEEGADPIIGYSRNHGMIDGYRIGANLINGPLAEYNEE